MTALVRDHAGPGQRPGRQEQVAGYGMVLPVGLLMAVFVGLPVAGAFGLSLFTWDALSAPRFVGLANYSALLNDNAFRRAMTNTVVYATLYVVGIYVVSLGLALLLNAKLRGSSIFRSVYFIPVAVAPVVAALLWTLVFDERSGLLNLGLGLFGVGRVSWLGSIDTAMITVVTVAVWQAVGFAMVIQLAGLQDIPREFYEAADVDGAGSLTVFRRITLPLLKPTSAFVIITALIDGFTVFDVIYVMTHGGPANATTTVVYFIYRVAFQKLQFGYASAIAVVLFAILFVVSTALLRLFRQHRPEP